MSKYQVQWKRDIVEDVKECVAMSLSYELKRHYNLRRYPHVRVSVDVNSVIEMSNKITNLQRQYVVKTNILEIAYSDSKDDFVMSLRSETDVLKWLDERAILIGNGIVRELVRRCDELMEKPEDVILDITNAMRRL